MRTLDCLWLSSEKEESKTTTMWGEEAYLMQTVVVRILANARRQRRGCGVSERMLGAGLCSISWASWTVWRSPICQMWMVGRRVKGRSCGEAALVLYLGGQRQMERSLNRTGGRNYSLILAPVWLRAVVESKAFTCFYERTDGREKYLIPQPVGLGDCLQLCQRFISFR